MVDNKYGVFIIYDQTIELNSFSTFVLLQLLATSNRACQIKYSSLSPRTMGMLSLIFVVGVLVLEIDAQ